MDYLLDTHTVLWLLFNPEQLSRNVTDIVANKKSKCSVSIVSFWEIATKLKIGKLALNGLGLPDVKNECARLRLTLQPLLFPHITTYLALPLFKNHRDPFDRMLIATAISGGHTLLSRDTKCPQYERAGLRHLW